MYHYNCMKQTPFRKICLSCSLSKSDPMKSVKSTLFIGIVKKKVNDLEFTINVSSEELTKPNKI